MYAFVFMYLLSKLPIHQVSSYADTIAAQHDSHIILSIAEHESNWQKGARSSVGATGYMQVMRSKEQTEFGKLKEGIELWRWWRAHSKSDAEALAKYNGGYRAWRSGQCQAYAAHVLKRAAQLKKQQLAFTSYASLH